LCKRTSCKQLVQHVPQCHEPTNKWPVWVYFAIQMRDKKILLTLRQSCSGPGCSAACAGRWRPPRLLSAVPGVCARARVEAPSRWAAEPLSKKIALVPAATFQLWRACAARAAAQGPARCAPLPRAPDRGHSAPAPGAAARRELGGRAGELFAEASGGV
jgi:hypothetical protein